MGDLRADNALRVNAVKSLWQHGGIEVDPK